MKVRLACLLFVLLPWIAFAGPDASPTVVKGPHYTVTSWAGPAAAQTTLDLMEALVVRYNSLFLFDLSKAPATWNVVLYATKADFDAALAGQVPSPPSDYIYLNYADPTRSQLVAWVPADGSPVDEVKSLAFQGFFQYLWTFLPHPPAWIETGLATTFWNSRWDGKTLTMSPEQPFLETLQAKWKDQAPDLNALLTAPEGSLDPVSGKDLEAWGVVAFLLDSPDPTYARLFGAVLANLSPTATEESNRNSAFQRFQASKDLVAASKDIQAYWKGKVGYQARIDQGLAAFKEKNYPAATAAFQGALTLRPTDDSALYYAGLAAYETKDYTGADGYFAKVSGKTLPPGLLAYARGLTAFALKKNDVAKTFLTEAKTEDGATYEKLVIPVLEIIR